MSAASPASARTAGELGGRGPIRLVVYDLDGTLVDSAGHIAHTVNRVRGEFGLRALALAEVRPCIGDGARSLVQRTLFGRLDAGPAPWDTVQGRSFPDVFGVFMERYLEDPVSGLHIMEGVLPCLEALQARGVAQAILTNKPHDVTQLVVDRLGLRRFTPHALGPGAPIRGGELPPKPDPTGLEWLMAEAGATPAQTIMVGDGRQDAGVAVNAGTGALLIGAPEVFGPLAQAALGVFPRFVELGAALQQRVAAA